MAGTNAEPQRLASSRSVHAGKCRCVESRGKRPEPIDGPACGE